MNNQTLVAINMQRLLCISNRNSLIVKQNCRRISTASNIGTGYIAPGFEIVKSAFMHHLNSSPSEFNGVAFAAFVKGNPVVDLRNAVNVNNFSNDSTQSALDVDVHRIQNARSMVNVCALLLVDRGALEYEAPIARYWRDFGQNGKEEITVSELLCNRSGLTLPTTSAGSANIGDLLVTQLIKDKKVADAREKLLATILCTSELIKRVDFRGRSAGKFFAEEISKPFGIHVSSNNYESAKSMAKLYGALAHDAKIDGKPILSNPIMMKKAIKEIDRANKESEVYTIGGFIKPSKDQNPNAFTSGAIETYADMDRKLGVSLVANGSNEKIVKSYQTILNELYSCLNGKTHKYH